MLPPRARAAIAAGRAVSRLSRALGKGAGTSVGGKTIIAVDKGAIAAMAKGHPVALVSGTNGKTTTTRLLAAALRTIGPVVANAGANLPSGAAFTLAGAPAGQRAVLEVDESHLPAIADATRPDLVVLLNLSRDQLDRVGEVRMIAARWRTMAAGLDRATVVANADDPLVAWAALAAPRALWVAAGQPWVADATSCPSCSAPIRFGSDGEWACSTCDLRRPPIDRPMVAEGTALGLPGRANRANATMALAAAGVAGADEAASLVAMSEVAEVDGRYRSISIGATTARLLLAKNPAGWHEVLDLLSGSSDPVVISINSRVPDGRDVSWLWDVAFERLSGRTVYVTGERWRDLSVRLRYAEVEHRHADSVEAALESLPPGKADVVANYTSFQSLIRHAAA
jgi:UDP-N-acetylmuramyl tripeptide synthase